jgi:release factor glutamine methyltransferase
MQIFEALNLAKSLGVGSSERQILLLHCLGQTTHNKAFLLTHDQDILSPEQESNYSALLQRYLIGEPVAYLTGFKEFYGLDFKVTPATLIPRPDTETLVEWAHDCMGQALDTEQSFKRILDLGTGSGCIAISLKKLLPRAQLWATDISSEALGVARENSALHAADVNFKEGSWFDALRGEEYEAFFDLIVSNPPYIAAFDPHLTDLTFEPQSALVSGSMGLDAFKAILQEAQSHLKPGGWLLFEHGHDQGVQLRTLFAEFGFESIQSRNDLAGICRCTAGMSPKNGIIGH